eukprot:jgi/Tetstr1/455972/TSEL_042753.t1
MESGVCAVGVTANSAASADLAFSESGICSRRSTFAFMMEMDEGRTVCCVGDTFPACHPTGHAALGATFLPPGAPAGGWALNSSQGTELSALAGNPTWPQPQQTQALSVGQEAGPEEELGGIVKIAWEVGIAFLPGVGLDLYECSA